jgi:hypothetical protein
VDVVEAPPRQFDRNAMIVNLLLTAVLDVGLAILLFRLATSWGASEQLAYVVSCIGPLLSIGVTWARARTLSGVSMVILAFQLLSAGAAFVGGPDPRLLLVKDSLVTGGFGLVCLVSMLFPRPLMFYFGAKFGTDGTSRGLAWWNGLWQYRTFRRSQYVITTLWGVGFLVEAALRIALAYTVDFDTAYTIGTILPFVVLAALITATIIIGQRTRRASTV